ncbi:MAG: hypothetical protein WCJ07_08770 [Verrucomicrobiota bacterium]
MELNSAFLEPIQPATELNWHLVELANVGDFAGVLWRQFDRQNGQPRCREAKTVARNENCGDDLELLPAGIKTAGDAREAREGRTNE